MEEAGKQLIGRNLRRARELAGFSQEEFAELLNLSRATLSAVENGKSVLDSSKLLLASQLLKRPISDFFKEKEEDLVLLYRAAENAVPSADTRTRFQRLCEGYRELEEVVGVADTILPPPAYAYSVAHQSRPQQFAMQVAKSERERLRLGQIDPIENVLKLLDDNGVRIFVHDVDQEDVFGVSAFSQRYGPCILVNPKNHTIERNIFTVAHEYGHLLMHRAMYVNPVPVEVRDNDIEQMAHTFAAHFLVPEVGLQTVFATAIGQRAVGMEDLVFLKHHFRVSFKVIARRLKDSNLVRTETYDTLMRKLREAQPDEKREFLGLDIDLLPSFDKNRRFLHLARKAALESMVSVGKLAEMCGQNVLEARNTVQKWRKEMAFVSS